MAHAIAPRPSPHAARVRSCLTAGILAAAAGCVSQQTYEATRSQADERTRALDAARIETNVLEAHLAALQAANQKAQAALAEARAAIQQEAETASLVRQRADEKLAALQRQVATLVNQNRLLGRDMADAKQEGASLRAMMVQSKREVEEARVLRPSSALTPSPQPLPSPQSAGQAAPTPLPPTPLPPAASTQQPPAPSSLPAQPAAAPPPAKTEPGQPDESLIGKIKTWISNLCGWLFG